MTRLALISSDSDLITRIRAIGERGNAQMISLDAPAEGDDDLQGRVLAQRPNIVLAGPDMPAAVRSELTRSLDSDHPDLVVVWLDDESPEMLRRAMLTGARDLISPDCDDDDMLARLVAASEIGDRRRTAIVHGDLPGPDGADAKQGRVITVVSPKGGSGKTMLSTNLAVAINEQSSKGVVVVDLDLQFGDVSSALGMRPEYNVIDVLRTGGDATTMKSFLAAHHSGVFNLAAPMNAAEAEDAEPDAVAKLLHTLSSEFGHVVVDTGAGIDEVTLTAIESSTDIVFVTTVDVAAIHALRKAVVVLDSLGLDEHRRFFVLNRASSRTGLSRSEIEEVTGLAIDAEIPSHRAVSKAMNDGTPVLEENRRNKLGKAIMSVAALVAEPERAIRRTP